MKKLVSRRRFLKVAGFGAGAAALAACGGAAAPAAPAATTAPAKPAATTAPAVVNTAVDMRIAWWGSQDRHDRTIKVIELYQKKNPNVKIAYEFASFNDHLTKMTTQAAGNSLPDIMQQDYAWIAEWAGRGLIVPLEEYVASGALDLKDCADDFTKGGKVNGKLVALNLGSNSQTFLADIDIFTKAGLEMPKDNWTWDDFEQIATTIKGKVGLYGAGSSLWNEQIWKSLYLSLGGWAYADDGTALGYTDDKPFIDHLNRLLRLSKAGAIPTLADDMANYYDKSLELQAMATGKSASDSMWSNQIVGSWKAYGDAKNLKMLPLPRPAGGKSSNYIKPSQFFSITKDSKNKVEAAKFISFFTNDLEANDILFAERGVPIAAKVRDALKPKLGKSQTEMFNYVARVSNDVQPIRPPDPTGANDIVKNIYVPQVVSPVLYEKMKAEDAVALLRKEATAILAKNKK